MIQQVAFNLMLACLMTHELDAIDKKEWRLLFGLRKMDEMHASILFLLLHIPLVVIILTLAYAGSSNVAYFSRLSLDVFAVIHLGLHWRLRNHPKNKFTGPISYGPIVGAAILGSLHACSTAIP